MSDAAPERRWGRGGELLTARPSVPTGRHENSPGQSESASERPAVNRPKRFQALKGRQNPESSTAAEILQKYADEPPSQQSHRAPYIQIEFLWFSQSP